MSLAPGDTVQDRTFMLTLALDIAPRCFGFRRLNGGNATLVARARWG